MRDQSSLEPDGPFAEVGRIATKVLLGFGITAAPSTSTELVTLDGTRFSLDALLRKCRREEDAVQWPQIAYDHFAELTRHCPPDARNVDHGTLSGLRIQVLSQVDAPDPASTPALGTGLDAVSLVAELVVHRNGTTQSLTRPEVGSESMCWFWSQARRNTVAEPIDRRCRISREMVEIDVLEGDSPFVASKIVDIPHLIASEIGEAPYGVMLAIPNRHTLAFHRLTNSAKALASAHTLIDFADHFAKCTTTPVSRDVFYWYDGQLQQLTRSDFRGLLREGVFDQVLREIP